MCRARVSYEFLSESPGGVGPHTKPLAMGGWVRPGCNFRFAGRVGLVEVGVLNVKQWGRQSTKLGIGRTV